MHAGTVTPVTSQRFLNVNRRLSFLDPCMKVMDKPVQRRGHWHVVYVHEKIGCDPSKKNRKVRLSQKTFATFDEANSCQAKLQVAERLLSEFSKRKIVIGANKL
jgi:hypothetical protein